MDDELMQASLDTADLEQLRLLSSIHFPSDVTADQAIGIVRELIEIGGIHEEQRNHFGYKLFELEQLLGEFGGNIRTSIREENLRRAYKKMQEVLQRIGYYDGDIDGDQRHRHILKVDAL